MSRPHAPNSDRQPDSRPALSLRELLAVLFLEPQLLLLVAGSKWGKALRYMLGTTILAGLAIGLSAAPRLNHAAKGWADWFANEVKVAWIQDSALYWQEPAALPATHYHENWRIDFMAEDAVYDPDVRLGPEARGLWLSPTAVFYWRRMPETDKVVATQLLNPKLMGMLEENAGDENGLRLDAEGFQHHSRRLTLILLVPAYALLSVLLISSEALFYALVFAFVPFLLRVPMAARGFGQVFSFYLYLAIPPLVVATVYTVSGLPGVTFSTIFAFSYVFYLLYVLWQVRRTFRPPATHRDR